MRRRARNWLVIGSALLLFIGLAFVTVTLSRQEKHVPVQPTGTAAGRPHRVPAAATSGRVVNGKFIPGDSAGGQRVTGPVAEQMASTREVPGAVPPAAKPKPLNLPAKGKPGPEKAAVMAAPAPAKKTGYSAKTSRELKPASASQVVYANADGTKTTFQYEYPVNYRRPDGSWTPISTNLVPAAKTTAVSPSASSLANEEAWAATLVASPSASALPSPSLSPSGRATPGPSPSATPSSSTSPVPSGSPSASSSPSAMPSPSQPSATPPTSGWKEKSESAPESFAGYANASDLVSVPAGAGQQVSFGISGAAATGGSVSGSTVTYKNVRPGAAVSFTAGTGTLKEQIVLSSPSAAANWTFPLDLKGLKAKMAPNGDVDFVNAARKVVAYVPHGFMEDSKIDPHSGDGATSEGVTYSLITVNGRQAIKMTLDTAWLDSKSRVYPVTVDPSVKDEGTDGTTYVQTGDSDADNSGGSEIHAGTYDGGSTVSKSFLSFGNVASDMKNDTVLGVRLGIFNTWSYSCSPRAVYVYPVTSSWSPSSMSWPGPSTGGSVGSKTFATGWVPLGSTQSPCPASWEGISLNQSGTNLVNGWTHGTKADDGLAIGASSSDNYAWKKFASDATSSGNPFLAITYTTDGASYKLASTKPVTQVTPDQNGKFAIKVTNTGSSTWTSSNGYELSYRAYNSKGQEIANHPVFTPMPSTVAPGQTVTVDATVNSLSAGSYALDFDMYSGATGSSPVAFSSQGIAPLAVGLYVPEPAPTVSAVYPPTGYVSTTLQQQLSTTATDTGTVTYDFTLTCEPLSGQTCTDATVDSGSISKPYWTPPAADLDWNIPYQWQVKVTGTSGSSSSSTTVGPVDLEAQVPQPGITSGLGGSSGQAYDPLSGNYTTSATDAAVKVAGPPLEIDRTYNSLDPRTSGAFGAGWSTVADTSLQSENGGSTVLVTMPTGQQLRFGQNGDGTYAAPFGSPDALVESSSGTWTLRDSSHERYAFTSGGQLSSITDPNGNAQDFTYNSSNQLTTITDAVSGRTLTLTWATPSGASYPHVSSVSTQAPSSGGSAFTWNYTYSGDTLAQACAPTSTGSGCTQYSTGTGSHYYDSVLDANPRVYYQFGESSGTDASDEVDANLGTADGTYNNVTLGDPGPLAGSDETAASFNGTSSYVSLPDNLVSDSTDVSVGLWFKTTSSGVLFSYETSPVTASSTTHWTPALYVGTNGELYGEFWNGSVDPMHTSASVADGNWHYAVLTADSDSQSLYLDGTQVGSSLSGQIDQLSQGTDTIGAGYWSPDWPSTTSSKVGYFDGDIAQTAVYSQPLPAATVASQYALGTAASPEMTQVTLPSGNTYESATYDSDTGRLDTYTDQYGGQWRIGQPLATGYRPTSDSLGQVIDTVQVTDPASRQETYSYDMLDGGRLAGYSNGVDPAEAFGYDAAGFLTTVTDQDGHLVCMTDDVHGDVLTRSWYPVEPASLPGIGTGTETAACGGSTASSADCPSSGAPCTTFYSYYYNAANPVDPQNGELKTVRDGRSSSATDTTYETQYTYNTTGQLTMSTTPATSDFPSGRSTKYGYTAGTEPSPDGGTQPRSLLASETTPGGAKTTYQYYSNGDLAKVTEPSGRYTTYTYDSLGRPETSTVYTSTYPSGETTDYSWTPTGQQASVTYPETTNQVTDASHQLQDTYSYDDDNDLLSLTQEDLDGTDPSRVTSYTYNDHDEVVTATQPAGATSGGDAQDGGASSANPDGATTGYDYDSFGNVSQVTDPNGNQYRYSYNEYQEPTQETLYTSPQSESDSTATCTAPATQDPDGGCDLVLESDAYDPAGLLAATTDAMGRITNYAYNGDQEPIESSMTQACSASSPCTSLSPCTPTAQCTTGSVGTMTVYTYDGAGNVISQAVSATLSGGAGATTTTDYNYDAADRLTSEVNDATPSGASSSSGYQNRTTAYTYTADGNVLSKTVGTGSAQSVTDYGYDTAGDETSQTVQNGSSSQETSWTYDQNGLPLTETSPRGNVSGATASDYTTNYAYGPDGSLQTVTGPPVAVSDYTSQTATTSRPVTTYGYDTYGDQTQVEDPDGNVTTTAYDGDGRTTSVTQAAYTPPGASASITKPTTYGYDEDGNLTSITDPEGNTTSYGYDALGDVTSVTQPQLPGQSQQGTWSYTYDADGERLSSQDPLGNETQQTYDYFGNVATSTDALQNTTQYAYDYLGDRTLTETPDGSTTTSTYDGLGELTSQTDGAGDESKYDYDDQGNLAHAYNPDGTFAEYGYDQANQLTSVTDYPAAQSGQASVPLRSESFGYDADGDQTSVQDWNGNTTQYAYNAAGELTSQVQPVSSSSSITTSFGYDAAGNRTSSTSGGGHTTWTTYNSWNLPESVIEPTTPAAPSDGDTTWTTAYDADGRPSTVSEPGGVSLSYGYDPLGDITSESGTGASASTPDRSFTYDLDGRMASASAPGGTDTFDYTADSLLKDASGPSGDSSYTYNDDGLVSSETDAAGTTSYSYDAADRVSTESDPLTGSTLTWGYNADSNPVSVSYAVNGAAGPTESFGYDGLQRLTSDTLTSASGSVLASESYGYDDNGNLTSQTDGGGLQASAETYSYDEANRLTSASADGSTVSYGYDADGNLTADGGTTNTYNAQDQLTSSQDSAGTTSYSYTQNGDLSSVTGPSGTAQDYAFDAYGDLASVPGGVSYGYDALGRLVTRDDGSSTTSMSYLGTGSAVASDGADDYSYDPSGGLTAAGPAGGSSGSALMSDVHGDVTAAFSPGSSTSSLAGSASYGAYGTPSATGSMPGLGYQGAYTDPATGLVSMGARWYNPATGGFTSADTINGTPVPATVDGNPYAYADDDPLTGTDPSGHFCWSASCLVHDVEGVARAVSKVGSEAGCVLSEGCGIGLVAQEYWRDFLGGTSAMTGQDTCTGCSCGSGCGGYREVSPAGGNGGSAPAVPSPRRSPECGAACAVGGVAVGVAATCAAEPELCAAAVEIDPLPILPPVPPPPPQDAFAHGKAVPKASKALRDGQVITQKVSPVTSPAKACSVNCVKEKAPAAGTKNIQGTQASNTGTNTANSISGGDGSAFLLGSIIQVGIPETPEPQTQLQFAPAGSGNGGGGKITVVATDSSEPGEPGGSGNAGGSIWPQLGIGCVTGALGDVASGSEEGQDWGQLGEDAGLGCAAGAASNLGSGVGSMASGILSGFGNGVGAQMIGNRSWNPWKVNYAWAGFDSVLGAEENRAVGFDTENPSVNDVSIGNSLSGGLGVAASGICGILDRFTKTDC